VEWRDTREGKETRLGGILIERHRPGEAAGYPTLCKGRYAVEGRVRHAIEDPTSLNALDLLPELIAAGVAAVKIEGRQRSARYVAQVTRVWRDAIDSARRSPATFRAAPAWHQVLRGVSEGAQTTLGALDRPWA
jgi:putative protease